MTVMPRVLPPRTTRLPDATPDPPTGRDRSIRAIMTPQEEVLQ